MFGNQSSFMLGAGRYTAVAEGYRFHDDRSILVTVPDVKVSKTKGVTSGGKDTVQGKTKRTTTQVKNNTGKVLTLSTIPKPLIKMEYAVRGAIVARADQIRKELEKTPESTLPKDLFNPVFTEYPNFSELISANIGNPHAVGQKVITFHRQVLSCLMNPSLLELPDKPYNCSLEAVDGEKQTTLDGSYSGCCFPYPTDVRERAERYLAAFPAFGAYSASPGIPYFRSLIANWIHRRDGIPCSPESVFLTDGASPGIKMTLELLIHGPMDGILIPVPQYPLYSATITRLEGKAVPYYLDEDAGWALRQRELSRALDDARRKGITVKALVVINPGNPTGAMLKEDQMAEVIRFCEKERLVLMADEVYQDNVYLEDVNFVSFRKVLKILDSPLELVSFHSCSKSIGECGVRGGLMQLENWSSEAIAVLSKTFSVTLCANTMGQAMLASMTDTPQPGEPSYAQWKKETDELHGSLARKAQEAYNTFNQMPNMHCQPIEGAMYAFPQVILPPAAIAAAESKGITPDMLYCMELLEETGIICVPGSGFQQKPGTYHFRVTILPAEDKYVKMLEAMRKFHLEFLRKYDEDS